MMVPGGDESLVASLLDAMLGGAVLFDANGVVTHVNRGALDIACATREEFVGKTIEGLPFRLTTLAGDPVPASDWQTARALRTGELQPPRIMCMHRRDGTSREQLIQARPLRSSTGELSGVAVSFLDVTTQMRTEERLRTSEANWRLLARNVPDFVVVLDLDGRMVFVNQYEEGSTPEIVGKHVWDYVDEDHRDAYRARLEECKATSKTVHFTTSAQTRATGGHAIYEVRLVPVLADGRVERVVAVAEDLTERRELMAQLADQDRRAGVGLLAASVAHEILNPLTYVLVNIEYALREPESDADRLQAALRDAREGALRMKQVVNDLRVLGRSRDERLYVDVRAVLESAVRLAGPALSNATVIVDLPDVPPVPASESQLCQVALNLLVNAGHALRGRPEPREVRVSVHSHEDAEEVSLVVEDNGPGVPARLRGRIFDPFFTTKDEGTGLGLSLARDVVTRLGGRIEVTSEEGRGARFTVILPTTRQTPSEPPVTRR